MITIEENKSITELNTFAISASSRYFAKIANHSDIQDIISWRKKHNKPTLLLGGGSNLLFKNNFDGLLVQVKLQGKAIISKDNNHIYVKASAGENWHQFVRWTIDQGLSGLENLSLIPGTVGAAPVQNIGAYGIELVDRFESLTAIDLHTGEQRQFSREECRFSYRDSYFKSVEPGRFLIESVIFRLPLNPTWKIAYTGVKEQLEGKTLTAKLISDTIIKIRQNKLPDPNIIHNAGSFFKNPILSKPRWKSLQAKHPDIPGYPQPDGSYKTSAAWLIDQCNWKGYRKGDAGVYQNHALVLVNHGNASGEQIWALAEAIIDSVRNEFDISLEPEPKIIT
jgi:UDP-N-acetylmuramate dehydrogenase